MPTLQVQKLKKQLEERARQQLPEQGFLAGGAVAALLCAELWGGDFPVNDLDIFSHRPEVYADFCKTPFRTGSFAVDLADYTDIFKLRTHGYRVLSSSRDGLLNFVDVEASRAVELPRLVLSGFDLNCCQAGIDLETDQLVLSNAFKRFLQTGQLLVTNLATPLHTMIRLAKKQQEYRCYCDFKAEASLLAIAGELMEKVHGENRKNRYHAACFGSKYQELYLQHQTQLQPFSSLVCIEGAKQPLYALQFTVTSARADLVQLFKGTPNSLNSLSMATAFDLYCRPTTARATRRRCLQAADSGGFNFVAALTTDGYLSGHAPSDKAQERLEQFCHQHPKMYGLFNHYQLCQAERIRAMELISRQERNYPGCAIGWLETAAEYGDELPATIELLIALFEQQYLAKFPQGDLVAPLTLDSFAEAGSVRELVTCEELSHEGLTMHHCVGGHYQMVQHCKGNYRIFHLEDTSGSSTVALRGGAVVEHRGVCNSDPPPVHCQIAARLAECIPWEQFPPPSEPLMAFWGPDVPF